jgi:hypothetical protein
MGAKDSVVDVVMKAPDHILPGQNMGAKGSAVDVVMKATDHILPEGRTWVQKVQQWIL